MRMDHEELAWAAGLFEGEGCFSVLKDGRGPQASLSMVDQEIVEKFADIVGAGKIYPYHKPPYQPVYKWQSGDFEQFQHVVCVLWPWLGRRRKEKAKFVHKLACSRKMGKWKQLCKRGHDLGPYMGRGTERKCKVCVRAYSKIYSEIKRQHREQRKFVS
jgi:hypothetical protein